MIQVIERCFTIIELLREGDSTLSELSTKTNLQRTTLRNILRTLELLEIVGRENVKYTLGPKLIELGDSASARLSGKEPTASTSKRIVVRSPRRLETPQSADALPELVESETAKIEPIEAEPVALEPVAPRRWAGFRSG